MRIIIECANQSLNLAYPGRAIAIRDVVSVTRLDSLDSVEVARCLDAIENCITPPTTLCETALGYLKRLRSALTAPAAGCDKITQHWLSVALERIRAGEPEREVMRDYGYERSEEPFNHDPVEEGDTK